MKTFDERKKSVQQYMETIQMKRRKTAVIVTSLTLVVTVLALVLFVPYNTTPPDVRMYANSEYYGLIQQLNDLRFEPPKYKNGYQAMVGFFSNFNRKFGNMPMDSFNDNAMAPGAMPEGGEYVEVTDNQVAGVTEADIFKRSEKYVYYLRGAQLSVYSIDKTNSKCVGTFGIDYADLDNAEDSDILWYLNASEMYLSKDCSTVTVLLQGFHKEQETFTMIVNLDVTDPANIQETNRMYFAGSYLTSRVVDGDILLTYNYGFRLEDVDFDDPSTYVPQYGTPGNMTSIPGDDIICPENVTTANYTVVCKLNGQSLDVQGAVALLGYSQELYVSENAIYATHSYTDKQPQTEDGYYRQAAMTEITGISYAGDSLEILGTIAVEGNVKDQYSMDQFEGMLRIVTSTTVTSFQEFHGGILSGTLSQAERNVNLYCIDLSSWQIAAEVIAFAPDGEDAQSVRFDGSYAYVCTAEVITFTDPVYFFDLSDLDNITWTDTGTIDGYSTSLIQLGDGYLMGVGFGDRSSLKIEIYTECDGKVVSVAAYERACNFSTDYKSYFIDRERNLIGLAIASWTGPREYLLLQFDGYQIREVVVVEDVYGSMSLIRAFIDDGWLYVLSDREQGMFVRRLWGELP